MKKIFIITGEYSGDIHGGKVLEFLKQEMPDIEAEAKSRSEAFLRPF